VRSYPNYIPYSNELWEGRRKPTILTDSNVDWGQSAQATKHISTSGGIKECWVRLFRDRGVLEPHYYGVASKPLPTADSLWMNERIESSPVDDGIVLVSAGVLSGFEFGPAPSTRTASFNSSVQLRSSTSVFVF